MFLDLRQADSEPPSLAEPDRFLGRFTPASLERELEASGILAALADRGYPEVTLRADVSDGEHRLRILSPDLAEPLVELRASEVTCVVEEPLMRASGLELLYLLSVHWITLQNPRAEFTAERPPLPGQRYPGLGVGRRFYGRLMAWAHEWGKDALLNFPQYYHNAAFYASMFRFVSPARQGRFEALRRDLAGLHVCDASKAVDEGRVVQEPGGTVLRWEAAEMISPVTRGVSAYLDSEDYRLALDRARESARFRLTRG